MTTPFLISEQGLSLQERATTPATPDSGHRTIAPMDDGTLMDVDDTGATETINPQVYSKRVHHLSPLASRIIEGNYGLGPSSVGYAYHSVLITANQTFRGYGVPLSIWLAGVIEWVVPLAAGNWRLYCKHPRFNNLANMQFFVGNYLVGGVLGYAAVSTYEHEAQIRFTIQRGGVYPLRMKTTAHPASADNYFVFTRVYLAHEDELPA